MRARASIVIDRPPAEVFSHVADFDSHPAWRHELLSSGTTGPRGVGMQIFQRVSIRTRQTLLRFEVTEWEEPERLTFLYEGPPRVRGGFILRPEGGGTHLTIFASALLSAKADLIEDRIRELAESEARRDLARLKDRIERTGRGEERE